MTDSNDRIEIHSTHGAIVRLFGAILIILGSLNTMLSWRGGFAVMSLPVALLIFGLVLCIVGTIMRANYR